MANVVEITSDVDDGSSGSESPFENKDRLLDGEGAWYLGSELMNEINCDRDKRRHREGEYQARWGVIGEEVLRGEIGMPKAGKAKVVWEGVIDRLEKGAMRQTA